MADATRCAFELSLVTLVNLPDHRPTSLGRQEDSEILLFSQLSSFEQVRGYELYVYLQALNYFELFGGLLLCYSLRQSDYDGEQV